jgi:hypothetical protein
MFRWFSKKRVIEQVKDETKKGFESVKKDIEVVSNWIKYFDSEKNSHSEEINSIKEVLSLVKEEVEEIKNLVSVMVDLKPKKVFKTPKEMFNKQTPVYAVQTGVQTGVQTPKLEQFSTTERAIIWVILNSDLRLSYEDIATILGKEKSTIRGQINTIKQKSEIIQESIEKNGKKRLYIPQEMREKILKKSKVRVEKNKKHSK